MKNYFIDKYLTIYNGKQFQEIQHVQRWRVPDEESAKNFIKAATVHFVENPRGFSAYESYKILIKIKNDNYKVFYKEATQNGEIIQNV